MGVLASSLFTAENINGQTSQRLEDCAEGRPNPQASHIAHGQRGEHVRRLQGAMRRVMAGDSSLSQRMKEQGVFFTVNGIYDPAFAKAVAVYKRERNILNFRNQIDDIVGVQTIRRLDADLRVKTQPSQPDTPVKPNEFPKLDGPNCFRDENCPASDQFSLQMVNAIPREDTGGDKFLFKIRDTKNRLAALYGLTVDGSGLNGEVEELGGANPSDFFTFRPVRVTRFGPTATFGSFVRQQSKAALTLVFPPEDNSIPSVVPFINVDAGPFFLPSAEIIGGKLTLVTRCRSVPGAVRF